MYSGSSLVDLKAELTRKEEQLIQKSKKPEEYNKKGNQTFAKVNYFVFVLYLNRQKI